jgi:hypothetical protein
MVGKRALAAVLLAAGSVPLIAQSQESAPSSPQGQPDQTALIRRALDSAYGYGMCTVYVDLRGWQQSDWPEGEATVRTTLREKILPRYTNDPAVLQKDPLELDTEYLNLCQQTQLQYFAFGDQLAANAADAAEVARQKIDMQQMMSAAQFLGQCQIASAIYLGTIDTNANTFTPEHEPLRKFMTAKIYSQDKKYLPYPASPGDGSSPAVEATLAEFRANEEGERTYWADCDAVGAKLQQITQQLGGP